MKRAELSAADEERVLLFGRFWINGGDCGLMSVTCLARTLIYWSIAA